jgi:cell division topological specificity factor
MAEERVSIFQWSRTDTGAKLLSMFRATPAASPSRSADTAKERLQILLALERSSNGSWPNFLPQLQKDIMEVVKKYVEIDDDKVSIEVERGPEVSMLDINVELPVPGGAPELRIAG